MATARDLNEWEDPGLAFTEQDVQDYDIRVEAKLRLAELQDLYLVLKASQGLPYGLQSWANNASSNVRSWMTWICRQCLIPLPEIKTWSFGPGEQEERKPYTARAVRDGAWVISCSELDRSTQHLVRAVTLGRRAGSLMGWNKGQKSESNKYCNALLKQREGCLHWKEVVRSQYPPSKRNELDG